MQAQLQQLSPKLDYANFSKSKTQSRYYCPKRVSSDIYGNRPDTL